MSRVSLRYKPNRQYASHRLPFVGESRGGWSLWDVPLQGGHGGYDTGIALAQMLLIHLRQQDEKSQESAWLVEGVVLAMLDKARVSNDEQFASLSRQVLGFMRQIAPCIVGAAHHGCHAVDDLDIKQLLTRANAGLNSAKE
ncbi:hypothetical protein [Pseudomonas sp. Q1-7]|uniref:hypothetical protein n=1 Tax=Pseudomonas sp. Q1-7 TaxID=3020843 RepID=UPI002301987C|nr:hypothetical protein [Pseudomonas sp. Q1-7]